VAIGRPFISVDRRIITGMSFHERLKCCTIALLTDLQADLRAAAANHTSNRWPISLPSAMTMGFIGTPTGWVGNVIVFAAFLASILVEFIGLGTIIR
jgi:hypothetical protein